MKQIYTIIFAISLGLSLAGCSYFETGEQARVDLEVAQSVNVMEAQPVGSALDAAYLQNVARRTRGSVQVFSLDNPGTVAVQSNAGFSGDGDIVVSTADDAARGGPVYQGRSVNEHVEVYPLGGAQRGVQNQPSGFAGKTVPQASYVSMKSGQAGATIIYFDHNSTALNASDLSRINQVATMVQSGAAPQILVEGHASQVAASSREDRRQVVNLKISMDRAFAVSRALIKNGVPAEKIVTKAYGDTRPVRMDGGADAHRANRRVEVLSR